MVWQRLRATLGFFWQHMTLLLWGLLPVIWPLLLLADYRLLLVHGGRSEAAMTDLQLLLPQLLAGVLATAYSIRYTALIQAAAPAGFAACWQRAARTLPWLILVQMLAGVLIVAGFFLLILPGLFLMGCLLPAYVYVVERGLGPIAALKASWAAFRPQAWAVSAGLCLLLAVLLMVMSGLEALGQQLRAAPDFVRLLAISGLDVVGILFAQLISIYLAHWVLAQTDAAVPAAKMD